MHRVARARRVLALAASASVVALAHSAVTIRTVPLAPSGESSGGSSGQVVPLTSTSLLVCASGPDATFFTSDDVALFVSGLDQVSPTATPITVGSLTDWSGAPARLSATSVLILGGGVDNNFGTADDVIVRVDRLGSTNRVTNIVVGFLNESDASQPVVLDADTAVVATLGLDGNPRSADDRIAILTGLTGDTPSVEYEAAPGLTARGSGRPVPLSPRRFLACATGTDLTEQTADDEIYLFTATGNNWGRDDLATPFLTRYAAGAPVALTPGTAVVATNGADGLDQTADDAVLLLGSLDSGNGNNATVTPIPVPSIQRYGAGRCVRVDATTILVSTQGPDSGNANADDTVALITGLGTTNTVTHITVGFLSDDQNCGATPMGPDSFAIGTAGPNGSFETSDDELVVVSSMRTTPVIVRHAYSALSEGSTSVPLVLGPDALAYCNGGADGVLNDLTNGDDRLTVLTGATSATPVVEHVDLAGDAESFFAAVTPRALGGGRAALVVGGADGTLYAGNDDVVQIFDALPSLRALRIARAKILFNEEKPESGEKCSVKGTLTTDGLEPFDGTTVTVSVGNASQVIPISSFTYKKSTWKYVDPKNQNGWVKKVQFKEKTGAFQIVGKGLGTGLEFTEAGYVAVALEGNDIHFGEAVTGVEFAKGISYKATE